MAEAPLYDIHGNRPALRAVLADLAREDVTTIVVGGDVATGPLPRETISQLRAGGYPDVDELLLESLLEPMNADEVADLFERQAAAGA
jgi:Icc-related predicted phosphoesterase